MAICNFCERDMSDPGTLFCTGNQLVEFPDGILMEAIPYQEEGKFDEMPVMKPDPARRCHDCNVAAGGFHHPGCDMEECPRCHGQLLSCGCLDDPDEDEGEDGGCDE